MKRNPDLSSKLQEIRIVQAPTYQPPAPIKREEPSFYNMPSSPASNLMFETLGAGKNIGELPDRKKQVNHSTDLTVYEDGKKRQVSYRAPKAEITIELEDIDNITGSNKPVKKLLALVLIKANEQAIYNGQLTRDYISFSLQELIDIRFYKTPQSARRGFNSGMDTLTSMKLKGHIKQTNKKEIRIDALEVLFTGARIEKGQCTVYFNSRLDWSFIVQYFTIMPFYYFELSNRASDLLQYIFYLARQNTKNIKERGYFTINLRAIQHRLLLPSEKGSINPTRDIKQPIKEAITQIETAHKKQYGTTEFTISTVCDEAAPIAEYLENGYLKVSLTGIFAKPFIDISTNTEKQIEAAQTRKENRTDRAIAAKREKKSKQQGKLQDENANKPNTGTR